MRVLIALVVLSGCGGKDGGGLLTDGGGVPVDAGDGREVLARVPVTVNRDLDVLFVIDDSPSMLDKQTNLKNNFPNFINVLNGIEGGLPNLHLGVVSTDLGTLNGPAIGSGPGACAGLGKNGDLQTNGSTLVVGRYISDTKNTDGTRSTNYTGSLANAFASMASLGASGCGFEQPIAAARRALDNNPANVGFSRVSANLAIVFLTDEDDCSLSSPTLLSPDTTTLGPLQSFRCTRFGVTCDQGGVTPDQMNQVGPKSGCHSNETSQYLTRIADFETFFKGLKSPSAQVMIGLIGGPATPVATELRTPPGGGSPLTALSHACEYQGAVGIEVADPGVRMTQFAAKFPYRSVHNICAVDLSEPLADVALAARLLIGSACLVTTTNTPTDCIVTETTTSGSRELPQCGSATTECYRIQPDPINCVQAPHLKLDVQRSSAPPPDTVVTLRCKV